MIYYFCHLDASNCAAKNAREGANMAYKEAEVMDLINTRQKINMVTDVASDQLSKARESDTMAEAWIMRKTKKLCLLQS